MSGFDDSLRGAMQAKGYGGPADLAKAYVSLSRHLGADEKTLLRLPRSEDDAPAWRDVFKRLGAPEKPEEYELPEPGQGALDMRDWFKGVAHELGITRKQAKVLAEKFGGYLGEMTKKQGEGKAGDIELAARRIREKWGQEFDSNMSHAQRAVQRFGWGDDALAELRDGGPAGAERALELLAYIGRNQREDGFPGPEAGSAAQPFGGTPSAHRARFTELARDPAFMARFTRGDPSAVSEFRKLSELAYPEDGRSTAGGPPRY
jgi:hypothetical protein